MIKEELYIEGHLMDLISNKINRNLQIGRLGDVANRESNYSNTVKLPLTVHNMSVFEMLGVSGNISRKQYHNLQCRYIVDGIPLISNGYCVIQSITDSYEVVIYDGVLDIGERLKDKLVRDLNFNDLNHYLNPDNFENSRENEEGYIYAIGDFGMPVHKELGQPDKIRREYIAPSLFVHTVFDKIMSEAGVNYIGNFFPTNQWFRTELLAMGKGYTVTADELEFEELGTAIIPLTKREESELQPISFQDKLSLETISIQNTTYDAVNKELTFNFSGEVILNQDISYRVQRDNVTVQVWLHVQINGEDVGKKKLVPAFQSDDYELSFFVNNGDKLSIWIYSSDATTGNTTLYSSGSYYDNYVQGAVYNNVTQNYMIPYRVKWSYLSTVSISAVVGGQLLKFEEMVPQKLTQLEFVKDILTRYGLLIRPVKNSDTYEFIQFEELLNDREGAEDWSANYVATKEEKYATEYGRTNHGKWKYVSEIEVPTLDGEIKIDVETLKLESTLFESPFTISHYENRVLNQPYYINHLWAEEEDEDEDGNEIVVIANKETAPRIFRLHRAMGVLHSNFRGSHSEETPFKVPMLSLTNMDMDFFLSNYYKAFKNIVETYKEIDMDLYHNEIEIYNLNFFRLKYIKQYGKYFYLNQLKYSAGQVGTGSMIEINEFSQNEPPTELPTIDITLTRRATHYFDLAQFQGEGYVDPEFDLIKAIKITSGFNNPNVKMGTQNIYLNSETILNVHNGTLNLFVVDMGTLEEEDTIVFEYQAMDYGSNKWSEVTGIINVHVSTFQNFPPEVFVWHGTRFPIVPSLYEDNPHQIMGLFAICTDETGPIVSYLWEVVSYPPNVDEIVILSQDKTSAIARVPNNVNSVGFYTFKVTVCDVYGSCTIASTQTMEVYLPSSRPEGEPGSPYRGG